LVAKLVIVPIMPFHLMFKSKKATEVVAYLVITLV
jgi:hypothetical protein